MQHCIFGFIFPENTGCANYTFFNLFVKNKKQSKQALYTILNCLNFETELWATI